MRRLAAILLVAAGCSSPAKSSDAAGDEVKFEMGIAAQIAFDATKLKRGERVVYTVRLLGNPKSEYVGFAVVEEDAESLWIENKLPADPRPFIVKSRYRRRDAKLLERWAGEPGSPMPAKLYPRETKGDEPVHQRDSSAAQPQIKEEVDQVSVAGKTWTATKVMMTLTYPDGRKSVLTDWYHADVPFSVVIKEKSYGGLVKRQFGRMTMELLTWSNTGAKPELEIPR